MKMIAVGITVAFCFGIAGTDKKNGEPTNKLDINQREFCLDQ